MTLRPQAVDGVLEETARVTRGLLHSAQARGG